MLTSGFIACSEISEGYNLLFVREYVEFVTSCVQLLPKEQNLFHL